MRCQPNEIYVHKSEVRILPDHQHGGCISGQKQRSWRPEGSKDAQAATVKGEVWGPRRCAVDIWFYFQHTAQSIERCLTARSSTAGGLGIFMAVAGAMVAACVGAMFRDHRKQAADTSMLHKMLRKPINYTEHAKCRMDCRCAAICCQANASLLYL